MHKEHVRGVDERIKIQALIDNTAQSIFNYLKEIANKREIYERRWIWELLQNASDCSPADRKVGVRIFREDNRLIFTHNGRPFEREEIAHLIYHGTTKSPQDIGKFGTGFLVTHLLSKKVKAVGIRSDNRRFEFFLDRDGKSAEDIKELMERTWVSYQESVSQKRPENLPYTAKYDYYLDSASRRTVKEGIDSLVKIAPFVLAFSDKIGTVEVLENNHSVRFELLDEIDEHHVVRKFVEEEVEGRPPHRHELLIMECDGVEIAVKGEENEGIFAIESLKGVPRLFVDFPLFGTQDLPFPAVINSKGFEPTEKRDGIFLGAEATDDIRRNRSLLEKAGELFVRFVSNPDFVRANTHSLLNLTLPPDKDWLDKEWYIGFLARLIEKLIKVNIVKETSGKHIAFADSLVPILDGADVEKLWGLCARFRKYKDKIPGKRLSTDWAEILLGWESLGMDLAEREITIEKLVDEIERCNSTEGLKEGLADDADELAVLNDFYRLLIEREKQGVFDVRTILPNQNGVFTEKTRLFKDEGISDSLKNTSNKLGEDVRAQLLHSEVCAEIQNLLPKKGESEVLSVVVPIVKAQREGESYLEANRELFGWLLERGTFEHLEGYPLLSLRDDEFTSLSKMREEKPLAPMEVWSKDAKPFVGLFPPEHVVSSVYHEVTQEGKWKKLEEEGLILTDPLYKEKEKLTLDDLESLLPHDEELDEEKEHEIVREEILSKIAFLETKDRGIIDTVRKSKERGHKFLLFLIDYVLEHDADWRVPREIDCQCGSRHRIYPAYWLKPLRNRLWIPVRKDKGERPSAQNMASLLESHEETLRKCRLDKPSRLLTILGLSISELMMYVVAKDVETKLELDRAMGSLYNTFMTQPGQLSRIALLAEKEPTLFVEEIEKRFQTREQIRLNQSVGYFVEDLLRTLLEAEGREAGFKVEITGKGSDFVIENDFIKDGREAVFEINKGDEISFYVEVKTTSQDHVRMTLSQAKEAISKSSRYALCVVKLYDLSPSEEDVKGNARFVVDIGERIESKVWEAENIKKEQDLIAVGGDIEVEMGEGPIRFKIYEGVWVGGMTFRDFVNSLDEAE